MSFKLNKLYTTLTIGGHTVTLGTDHFDTDVTKEAITKKLEEGVEFSIGDQRLGATLGDIATWIEDFEKGLGLPDGLGDITGADVLNDVTVVITELSVTFSTKNPKFSIGMEIDFAEHFFTDMGIPSELEKWFRVDSMGISMSYAAKDENGKPTDENQDTGEVVEEKVVEVEIEGVETVEAAAPPPPPQGQTKGPGTKK